MSAAPEFTEAHRILQTQVEREILPGVASAVLAAGTLVDEHCIGWADIERGEPLRPDHIHRAFSNTKLATSCAVLLLADAGHFALDDPVKAWIPGLANLRVLRPGAQRLDDTEPMRGDITIRHLLSHQAGFSHAVFDPGSLLYAAYHERGARSPDTDLATLMEILGTLPLAFHPGTGWEYSLATDVLARLVEVVSGQRFDAFLQTRLFEPLGMVDTGFVLRPEQRARFTALYCGDRLDVRKPGLRRLEGTPWPGAYLEPRARLSGAGGLFTTRADMLALVRSLLPAGPTLLRPATIAEMMRNQLPAGRCVRFPLTGPVPSLGFGLAGAVTIAAASALGGDDTLGELQWGGLAGTHWWIAPRAGRGGVAGVVMTQRFMGFWHPFWFDYKRAVHAACGAG